MKKILLWRLISIICVLSLISVSAAESTYRHWPFDELTEQGAMTPDDSANKAHIRLSGQELCDGVIGKALQFKAGGKGIVLGDLNLQAPATLCFWLKTEIPQSDARILSQLEGSTYQSGALRLVGGNLQVFNTSAWPVVVSALSNRGTWQHVALVYQADGTLTGYLNGRKSQTASSAFDFKEVKAGLGAAFLGQHGTPFVGALDDFRIYNRALEEKEIKSMYPPKMFNLSEAIVSKSVSATDTGIVNGSDWMDTDGNRIVAHEGDIARFNGVFYWYGSSYENNPEGRFGIAEGPIWNGVLVYRSTDLKNWEYRGVCLPRQKGFGELGTTGRSHVMYNERTKKYVMWYRWYLHVPASVLMVAVADHPEGPFTSLGVREMGSPNGFASDMNVFKDDDGKAYVIYCDHGEHGVKGGKATYRILIDSLSDDYLTSNRDGVAIFDGGCEAPAMIKYKGKYIAVASGVHGWAGSDTKCAVADSPLGRYEKQADISEQKTWSSQVTDLIYLKESDTVMVLCDQWWIPDKSDINKSRYLFLPLYLDEKTGKVKMEYREKWNPLEPVQ
jgi:hypothetical protein